MSMCRKRYPIIRGMVVFIFTISMGHNLLCADVYVNQEARRHTLSAKNARVSHTALKKDAYIMKKSDIWQEAFADSEKPLIVLQVCHDVKRMLQYVTKHPEANFVFLDHYLSGNEAAKKLLQNLMNRRKLYANIKISMEGSLSHIGEIFETQPENSIDEVWMNISEERLEFDFGKSYSKVRKLARVLKPGGRILLETYLQYRQFGLWEAIFMSDLVLTELPRKKQAAIFEHARRFEKKEHFYGEAYILECRKPRNNEGHNITGEQFDELGIYAGNIRGYARQPKTGFTFISAEHSKSHVRSMMGYLFDPTGECVVKVSDVYQYSSPVFSKDGQYVFPPYWKNEDKIEIDIADIVGTQNAPLIIDDPVLYVEKKSVQSRNRRFRAVIYKKGASRKFPDIVEGYYVYVYDQQDSNPSRACVALRIKAKSPRSIKVKFAKGFLVMTYDGQGKQERCEFIKRIALPEGVDKGGSEKATVPALLTAA